MKINNRAVPTAEVSLVKRRMFGASKRIARLRNEKTKLATSLRVKGEYKAVKDDGAQRKFMPYSAVQLISFRANLQAVSMELKHANVDCKLMKKQFSAAVSQKSAIAKQSFKSRVTAIKLEPEIPELVDAIVKAFETASSNEAVQKLITISTSGKKKDFAAAFDDILRSIAQELYEQIDQDKKIKSKIVAKVMTKLKSASPDKVAA